MAEAHPNITCLKHLLLKLYSERNFDFLCALIESRIKGAIRSPHRSPAGQSGRRAKVAVAAAFVPPRSQRRRGEGAKGEVGDDDLERPRNEVEPFRPVMEW